MPKLITFSLDAKDEGYNIGDLLNVNSRELTDLDGSNLLYQCQIIEMKEVDYGDEYEYKAITSNFLLRYGFVAPTSSPEIGDYTAASEENQRMYCWIAQDSDGKMSNGDDPYLIV